MTLGKTRMRGEIEVSKMLLCWRAEAVRILLVLLEGDAVGRAYFGRWRRRVRRIVGGRYGRCGEECGDLGALLGSGKGVSGR
jgi:hypothetical protein